MAQFFQEYGLMIAVALPPAVIVAINLALLLTGERGTLLLPSSRPFPSIKLYEREAQEELQAGGEPAPACESDLRRAA